jgi:SAM-dependent methyltransferase
MSRPSDETLDYYERNASAFIERTLAVPMESLYQPFLELVPLGGHILDAGCGSGRDAREFKRRGYRVTAIDASPELAGRASAVVGVAVEVLRFQDLAGESRFDGIWACASLLHVPRTEVDEVFARFARALRVGGAWYMSFKFGEAEEVREGRLFSDYTEDSLRDLLGRHPCLTPLRLWLTSDFGPQRSTETWLNAIVRREPPR